MPAFTSPTRAEWTRLGFVDAELALSVVQRQNPYMTHEPRFTRGDTLAKLSSDSLASLQADIEAAVPAWLDHTRNGGDFSGETSFPTWTVETFCSAAGLPYDEEHNAIGWRRLQHYSAEPVFSHGALRPGDIIGKWIFEDLQKAMTCMRWSDFPYATAGDVAGKGGYGQSGYVSGVGATAAGAKALAEANTAESYYVFNGWISSSSLGGVDDQWWDAQRTVQGGYFASTFESGWPLGFTWDLYVVPGSFVGLPAFPHGLAPGVLHRAGADLEQEEVAEFHVNDLLPWPPDTGGYYWAELASRPIVHKWLFPYDQLP
jgi:hypothetical protein